MWQLDVPEGAEPIGYRFLVEHFKMEVIAHYRWSFVGPGWESREFKYDDLNLELRLYPKSYQIDKDPLKHLEFALKHEGLNLGIIKNALSAVGKQEVTNHVLKAPTGKYARKIWFLYEFLLDDQLPIEDVRRSSYVNLLDSDQYYCGRAKRSPRHRVVDNLLGNAFFCPVVRRSAKLSQFESQNLHEVVEGLTKQYDANLLARATRYLYTKETIASWEIERETPGKARVARFVGLLQRDYASTELSKSMLVTIQKEIVDPRFVLEDYRTFQNYVGEEPLPGEVRVHYIAPTPQDLPMLMDGLIRSAKRMFTSNTNPVVVAAVLSFGFVFMHPFWDGNGREHRFLIHYTLSKYGFAPKGIVFPVSAVMLREYKEYDKALESFSKPLSELIRDYEINGQGEMTINQKTIDFYKYVDFTPLAEFLYWCVERTIHTDLEEELDFLSRYDIIKRSIKEIVDMPDRQVDLFIKCVRQNNGILSNRKRESLFNMLTESEIHQMEEVVRSGGKV